MTGESRNRAEAWKREKLAQLKAEYWILQSLLKANQDELAEVSKLDGDVLSLVYESLASEPSTEQMREQWQQYSRECADTWLAGEHILKNKSEAA